jgi:hypothetical protein
MINDYIFCYWKKDSFPSGFIGLPKPPLFKGHPGEGEQERTPGTDQTVQKRPETIPDL